MKENILLIGIFLFLSKFLFAQNYQNYDKTHHYETTAPVIVTSEENSMSHMVEEGTKFTVIGRKDNNYKILFWVWENKKKGEINQERNKELVFKTLNSNENSLEIENRKVFILEEKDFDDRSVPFYKKAWNWSAGFVVLPVKIRNTPTKTYSKDLSLGFSGGAKYRLSNYNPTYLNFLFNIGLSSVTVDSLTTKGKIRQPSDIAALTTAFGVVFENHAFQFGLFYGWDRLSSNDFRSTGWEYNRKPWISLGLGFQILSKDDKSKKQSEGKN